MSNDDSRSDIEKELLEAGMKKASMAHLIQSVVQDGIFPARSAPLGTGLIGGYSSPKEHTIQKASPPEVASDSNAGTSGPASNPKQGLHSDWSQVFEYIDRNVPTESEAWDQEQLEKLLGELKKKAANLRESKAANQVKLQLEEVLEQLQENSIPRAESLEVDCLYDCLEWRTTDFHPHALKTVIEQTQHIIDCIDQAVELDTKHRAASRKEQKPLFAQLEAKIDDIEHAVRDVGGMRETKAIANDNSDDKQEGDNNPSTDEIDAAEEDHAIEAVYEVPEIPEIAEPPIELHDEEESLVESDQVRAAQSPQKNDLPETKEKIIQSGESNEKICDPTHSRATPEPPPSKATSTHYQSWAEFSKRHWISPSGEVELAPWSSEKWQTSFEEQFRTSLEAGDLWRSYIYCRAAEDSGIKLPTPSGAIEHLITGRSDLDDNALAYHDGCKICCTALALHGSCPPKIDPDEFVGAAKFKSQALRSSLCELLKISRAGSSALTTVSQKLQQAPKERIEKRVDRLQAELTQWKKALNENRSIGAVVHQTHCREAWETWMTTWRTSFEGLSAAVQRLISEYTFDDGSLVRSKKIASDGKKTFDKMQAKYQSRGKMDKRSALLLKQYDALWDHAIAFERSTKEEEEIDVDHDAWLAMRDEDISDPLECTLRNLVASLVYKGFNYTPPSLTINAPVVCSLPHILGGMTPGAAEYFIEDSSARSLPDLTADMIQPQWVASSLLIKGLDDGVEDFTVDQQHLIGNVVTNLARHARMHALASRLIRGMSQVGTEIQELQLQTNAAIFKSREACVQLKHEIQALRGLADSEHEQPLSDCEQIITGFETGLFPDTDTCPRFPEPSLVDAWCSVTKIWAQGRISLQVERIRDCIARIESVSERKAAEVALADKRYVDAIAISQTGTSNQIKARYRSTMWRDEAEREWNGDTPVAPPDTSGDQSIVDDWRGWNQGKPSGKQAHTIIVDLLRRDFSEQAAELKSTKTKATLAAKKLLELLNRFSQDRACHLPELHDFDNIVLVSCTHQYCSETFSRDVSQYLKSQATGARSITVCIAPRIPAQLRATTISWMQEKSFFGAIIDDIDFRRLMYCDNRLAGLMECVFEQIRFGLLHPFSMVDGSKMRTEVFVGRREQARDIAQTQDFSRIFSGRKLGKSALLRYVSDTYDGHKLSSEITLGVVYLQILGLESESTILENIARAFSERYGINLDSHAAEQRPFEKLTALITKFSEKKPDQHVLFVLDEADEFVRAQLESIYHKGVNQNQTLSMAMSRAHRSVRFLVAGYVTTNTSDGPWINWGRILRLSPLDESDGRELVAEPLAKIGIDASEIADSVAFLCGYQPAIIHAFGRSLIESLDKRIARKPGSRPRISTELADAIFHSIDVQSEIRNVTLNNFQDDLAARAVFLAMIHAFHEMPAFEPIYDAVSDVIDRLQSIGGEDLSWLGSEDPRGRIDRLLTAFVERNLIIPVKDSNSLASGYALKFPHHLPSLWSTTIERDIQRQIAALGKSAETRGPLPRSLDGQSLRDIVDLANNGLDGICQRSIIASQWPELYSGIDGSCGIKSCEGIDLIGDHITENASFENIKEHRENPDGFRIFIGGPSIIRSPTDSDYIPFLGRLSRGLFERRLARDRGILFDDASLREQLYGLTGGIPVLCKSLDSRLIDECSISNDSLQQILDYKDEMYRSAWQQLSGASSLGLTDQELDLLVRICAIQDGDFDGPSIQSVLSDAEMLKGFCIDKALAAEPIDTDRRKDQLVVLLRLGLLPVSQSASFSHMLPWESLGKIAMDDPIRAVIKQRSQSAD
ncbi:ATP-binding protein [Ectothiorhodospira shaposhnikovii]|uniref:ATP-binding protein n=1 Tax=Ectothiorhodospira shaposhnikovii TaxID=1054 RepID=UPI001EE947FD|nr:ATP-binding protein [Ectothiorhodospira shaposhnikovii]MCG5512326.1 ATP-binding protein [Ectothiorhodospira shaposhnikovii]